MTASLGRLVLPSLRWRPSEGGFAHERGKIDAALAAGVGGFIIFGGSRETASALTRDLTAQAGRPLLIGADLERGAAQQVQGLTELPPPAALGFLDDLDATHAAGLITATEARSVGISWAFGPVCDLDLEPRNPIVQTRSFGADPLRVGEHAAVWIRGCQEHGVLACAKHYPGHGRTTVDSHETLPRVTTPAAALQRVDGEPFEHAIRAGVGGVMTAHVAYPAWAPSGRAATFDREIMGYLRDTLHFDGLVATDALIMAGATAQHAEAPATVAAVAAGCDILLYPQDFEAVAQTLDRAVGREIPVARADEALARYDKAVNEWGRGKGEGGRVEPDFVAHAAFADGLADRALHVLRGDAGALRLGAPLSAPIVDDDAGGPYVVGPRDVFHATIGDAGLEIGKREAGSGKRIVLVYAEPRSWKGRAWLGSRSLTALRRLVPGAALVVLFGHPRLARQIPGTAPIVCAWHGQALMQRAAARIVLNTAS